MHEYRRTYISNEAIRRFIRSISGIKNQLFDLELDYEDILRYSHAPNINQFND